MSRNEVIEAYVVDVLRLAQLTEHRQHQRAAAQFEFQLGQRGFAGIYHVGHRGVW